MFQDRNILMDTRHLHLQMSWTTGGSAEQIQVEMLQDPLLCIQRWDTHRMKMLLRVLLHLLVQDPTTRSLEEVPVLAGGE